MGGKESRRRQRRRRVPRIQPGAAPGTIAVEADAPRPVIKVTGYSPDKVVETRIDDLQGLHRHLQGWPVVWVNVDGLGDEAVLREMASGFGIHRLAMEDVVNVPQRAKAEPYDEHLFLVLRMPGHRDSVETEQVSLFLGENWVLTFQERSGDCFDPVRTRIREGKGRIRRLGADYLAYALVDAVVDGYFPLLESTADRLDALEEEVLGAPDRSTLARIQEVKSELRSLQKAARPHRDLLSVMLQPDAPFVREPTQVYLRDSLDHAIQVSELIESYRETSSDIMGAYLSSMSNRMNEVMKVLTIIASIFIPLSFLAGLYGMNFNPEVSPWNMPELNWAWGYPAALGVMALVALAMLMVFAWRGWFR